MRFLACAVLLLSAAVLTSAAVARSEDNEVEQQRFRAFRKNEINAEGRSLFGLFGKGGCDDSDSETTSFITHDPTTSHGTSDFDFIIEPTAGAARDFADNDEDESADDFNDDEEDFEIGAPVQDTDNRRHPNTARQYDYELRRQEDENKQLRRQIQFLRVRNMQNLRRANRARRQQQRRNDNNRRQMLRRLRNNRRRNNTRRRNRRNRIGN